MQIGLPVPGPGSCIGRKSTFRKPSHGSGKQTSWLSLAKKVHSPLLIPFASQTAWFLEPVQPMIISFPVKNRGYLCFIGHVLYHSPEPPIEWKVLENYKLITFSKFIHL